jgi:hypothetical protein
MAMGVALSSELPPRAVGEDLAGTFLAALCARDFDRLAACFRADVRFRALVPPGLREGTGSEEAIGWLRRWFGDAADLTVLAAETGTVADRLHIAYRFHLRKSAEWLVIEQQAYCTVEDGGISDMAILCSGFRPAPASCAG